MQVEDDLVDEPDAREGADDAAEAVDQEVAAEDGDGGGGAELDAFEGQRNQGDDDDGVEDDGAEDGAVGRYAGP